MSGWLYIIKNGDLYKIGITKNFDNRMRQLKPDCVIAKLFSSNFLDLEKELHKRYKDLRIPQTEYFRLDHIHLKEIKQRISKFYYPRNITYYTFAFSFCLLLVLFIIIFLLISLYINDFTEVLLSTLYLMEKFSFYLSILSFAIKSDKNLNYIDELKFRFTRSTILFVFSFFFKVSYYFYSNKFYL